MLAGMDEVTASARRALLAGDQDRLQAVAAFGKTGEIAAINEHLAQVSYPESSLDALACRLESRADDAGRLARACDKYGIPPSTRAASFPDICKLLRAAHEAAVAARLPEPLSVALGSTAPLPLHDHGLLRAALILAGAVESLPVSDRVRRHLQCMDLAHIRAVVKTAEVTREALVDAVLKWNDLKSRLQLDETSFLSGLLSQSSPGRACERLRLASSNGSHLGGWVSYLLERREAEALGLQQLLLVWDQNVLRGPLSRSFDRVLYHNLACLAFARYPTLDRFTGLGQDEARSRFRALDRETTELRRNMLISTLTVRPVPNGHGSGKPSEHTERELILREIGKKKRHIPIRQLLDRAGAAAQALKPCFMMSPLSVSQYPEAGYAAL